MDTFFDSQFTSITYLWLNGLIISSLTVMNLVYGLETLILFGDIFG